MRSVAVVLAGGRAERFGKDKLVEIVDGACVLARVVRAVEGLVDAVYLAAREAERCRFYASVTGFVDALCLEDTGVECRGPAAPIVSAGRVTAERYLIVAGDMPWLDGRVVERLASFHRSGALSVLHGTGMLEPLIQVLDRESVDRAARLSRLLCRLRGKLRPTDVLRAAPRLTLVGSGLLTDTPTSFAHANTPVELRSYWARNPLGEKTVVELTPPLSELVDSLPSEVGEARAALCRVLGREARLYASLGLRHLKVHAEGDYRVLCGGDAGAAPPDG